MEIEWRKRIEVWLGVGLLSLGLAVSLTRYLPASETVTTWAGTLLGVALAACFICFTLLPGVLKKRNNELNEESGMKMHWYNSLELWFVVGLLMISLSVFVERYLVPSDASKFIAGLFLGLSMAANIMALVLLPNELKNRSK